MERSKLNKHVACNEDDGVDNDVDSGVGNGDVDSVEDGDDDGDDGSDTHLTYLSQAADCCLTKRSKLNMHVVCNEDDDVDDDVDNGDDDGDEDGDDGVDNGVDGADKHLTHLSQAAD
eukprot:14148227-Ditylum_brightwellii.AAC.1